MCSRPLAGVRHRCQRRGQGPVWIDLRRAAGRCLRRGDVSPRGRVCRPRLGRGRMPPRRHSDFRIRVRVRERVRRYQPSERAIALLCRTGRHRRRTRRGRAVRVKVRGEGLRRLLPRTSFPILERMGVLGRAVRRPAVLAVRAGAAAVQVRVLRIVQARREPAARGWMMLGAKGARERRGASCRSRSGFRATRTGLRRT